MSLIFSRRNAISQKSTFQYKHKAKFGKFSYSITSQQAYLTSHKAAGVVPFGGRKTSPRTSS